MKKLLPILFLSCLVAVFSVFSAYPSAPYGRKVLVTNVTDIYRLDMRLYVPVIVNNMESLGRREYKYQRLRGELRMKYSGEKGEDVEMTIVGLTNRSYAIQGALVSYSTSISEPPIWSAVGNNFTSIFKKSTLSMRIDADPSYNIGDDQPDNTILLTLACQGSQFGTMRGYAAGQIGCGCYAYGHVSPTRAISAGGPSDNVVDIAALFGYVIVKWIGYEEDQF